MRLGGNKYRIIFSCWIHNIKIEKCDINLIVAKVATPIYLVKMSIKNYTLCNLNRTVLNIAKHKSPFLSSDGSLHGLPLKEQCIHF